MEKAVICIPSAMETMKASRRKQTKPNRNPFGMDPPSGSFNPAVDPASRPSLPDDEAQRLHHGEYGGPAELARDRSCDDQVARRFDSVEGEDLTRFNGGSSNEEAMPANHEQYSEESILQNNGDYEEEQMTGSNNSYDEEQGSRDYGSYEEQYTSRSEDMYAGKQISRERGAEYDREVMRNYSSFDKERQTPQEEREMNQGRRMEERDAPLDMSAVNCKLCPETFTNSTDLHHHIDMAHRPSPKRPRMDFEFPTAYHRLGSELIQENLPSSDQSQEQDQPLSLAMPKPDSERPDMYAMRDQNGEGRSVKVNGGRIFHMDAYCDLCDREFCNKYFLKTHKAIKHGICDDSPPLNPSTPEASHKPSGLDLSSMPSKMGSSPSPWQHQQEQKKESKLENKQLSPASKKSEADLDAEKKVSSVISAVKNSLQNGQSDGKSSSSSSSGNSTKDPSMEDYCEFCQKHFCNKYYLKKHKQDVHGIIPETGPTPTKRSRANNSLLDLPMPSSSMASHMMLPQAMGSLGGMPALPPGVMVLNPFMPQMSLLPGGGMPPPLLHPHQLHPPPHSPILSQSLPMLGSVPGLSPTTPSSQMSELSPNPDTFCTLCSKEFSNVYFLKIHKANRHGIQCDEIPPEAKMLGDMVESNGVLVHPRPSSMDGKQERSSRSSPPPLTSINQMVTCRLCDKDFPNAHAFKIHQVNEHGKNLEPSLPDSFESSLPKPERPLSSSDHLRRMSADLPPAYGGNPNGPGGTIFGSMVAAKLADRVICDICNKDLCNKYFLKAHKLKMHGIDVDKEEGNASEHDAGDNVNRDRYSPNDPNNRAQPLNMTVSPKPAPPLPAMPKVENKDYSYGMKEFKQDKPAGFKHFSDVPSFLSETINNEYMRRATPQPPFKGFDYGLQGFPPSSSANMNPDQMFGDGIDPEAYCDICKKEFCSKYFLRTHKENIHGIKTEVTTPVRSRPKPLPKPALPKMNSLTSSSSNLPMASLPMPSMPFPFPPSLMMRGNSGGGNSSFNRRDSFEKHHFRWKDPPTTNATARVTCDICNKEVCNKYFLRTHKLKKHGVAPTDSTQSSMTDSPAPSENDGSSNHSSQPDNFLVDKGTGTVPRSEGMPFPHSIPLPPSERAPKVSEPMKINRSEEEKVTLTSKPVNNNNNHTSYADTVTCHLCERRFKNMQWLSAHLKKDHAEAYGPDLMDLRMFPPPLTHLPPFNLDLEPKMCRVCRIMLPNEVTLQLHLLQEHNAQIKLQMDETSSQEEKLTSPGFSRSGRHKLRSWRTQARPRGEKKLKMFVCSFGDYRTNWLYKLQNHEETVHSISTNNKQKLGLQESCPMEKEPQHGEQDADAKQFKCGLCASRFKSHTCCQMHLREAHIHMHKDFVARKRKRAAFNKLSCRYCSFTTSFPFRLQSHTSRYHHRPSPPAAQEKNFTPVAGSETPPESLHSSPDHSALEETVFDRSSAAQDLRKRPYVMDGEEPGPVGSLADSYMASGPADSRVHQSLSAPYRVSDFTP